MEVGGKKQRKEEDISDDDFASFGLGRGSGRFDRGRGKPSRFDSPRTDNKQGQGSARGRGTQGRGGPSNRGNRGGQTQNRTAYTETIATRGRGRGQAQRGMPPNVFDWRKAS